MPVQRARASTSHAKLTALTLPRACRCNNQGQDIKTAYGAMSAALNATGRPIAFNMRVPRGSRPSAFRALTRSLCCSFALATPDNMQVRVGRREPVGVGQQRCAKLANGW